VVKCGDLGSDYQYTIITASDQLLWAQNGGGLANSFVNDTINLGSIPGDTTMARYKFVRQSDGSYALQTSNGVNFVTALGGGDHIGNHRVSRANRQPR
jgi:hypothetical protein